MSIGLPQKTAAQIAQQLATALLNRTNKYDTGFGPVPDVVFNPLAAVLEDQNNNGLVPLSLLLSLQNSTAYSDDLLNSVVFNENILRPLGSYATVTLTFSRSKPFASSDTGLVPAGYPVATQQDEASGQSVTFVTTQAYDKTYAVAVLDPASNQTVYQLNVPAVCLIAGSAGSVGANQINIPLRPLVNYDSVSNTKASQVANDTYTNAQLIQLYLLAVNSRQLSVSTGSEFYALDNFAQVQDINEVFGTNPLLTRAGTDAGAVDAWIQGVNLTTQTDQIPFLGIGQTLVVSLPPIVQVDSVSRVSDGHIFIQGTDFQVFMDPSGVSGSTRAQDGIQFLPLSSAQISAGYFSPTPGDLISITYGYNALIQQLQSTESDPEVMVEGRDLLYRQGTDIVIYLAAEMTTLSTFVFTTVQNSVIVAILAYINGLTLGSTVEVAKIIAAAENVTGVDNFIVTQLSMNANVPGTVDISLPGNQYPTTSASNLQVTPI